MKLTLVVMAAGIGSRFGGIKQAEPVGPCGEMLLDYALFDARRAGIERVVFVLRRGIEGDFRRRLGLRFEGRMEAAYAFQEVDDQPAGFAPPPGRGKPWGTGQAVLAAAPHLRGSFVVINADDFYGAQGFRLLADFLAAEAPAPPERCALVAYRLAATLSEHGPVSRGVCAVSPEGLLAGIAEHKGLERVGTGSEAIRGRLDGEARQLTGEEPVSMNFWGFRQGILPHLEERFARFLAAHGADREAEYYLPSAVDELIRAGVATVEVLPTSAPWFGITHRADLPLVAGRIRRLVEAGEYPAPLWG